MSDAITNLGGGGLDSPWLANLSTCLSYACSFLCTLIGGPLINKIGIKWSCFIAAVAMPLHGSAFYVDSKYDVDWFLLLGNVSASTEQTAKTVAIILTCVDHQRKYSRLSLRRRNHGHAVVPEAGGSGLLPWYALLDGRLHVLGAGLTV
jgi:hypothetical protein